MATQTEVAQKITAAVLEAERRILPARLVQNQVNIFALMAYITAKSLDQTQPETYVAACKALMHQLEWIVKPAQLVVQETGNKPPVVENQLQAEAARAKIVKAAEQRDKDAKEHSALVTQCKSIIEGYCPTNRHGYDAREREEMQALWVKELHKAKEKSVEAMRIFAKDLVAKREKRYADRERASEHL